MSSTTERPSLLQTRHMAYIAEFTFDIRYVKGETNFVADALSRPSVSAMGGASVIYYEESSEDQALAAEGGGAGGRAWMRPVCITVLVCRWGVSGIGSPGGHHTSYILACPSLYITTVFSTCSALAKQSQQLQQQSTAYI